jgi:hypothetical protein
MKEIDAIIKEVKNVLASKEKEIQNLGDSVIAYIREDFKNRRMEVFAFETNLKTATKQPFIKSDVLKKCKNDAQELMIEINKIKAT